MEALKHGLPVNGILAALYYLSQEAQQAGRVDVSAVLRHAIVRVDALSRGEGLAEDWAVADVETCAVLSFFDSFVQASPDARSEFVKLIAEDDGWGAKARASFSGKGCLGTK